MIPTPHVPNHASATSQYSLPASHDAVGVPRSSFNPCADLQQELEQIDMLQDADDFGYSLYREVCDIVGHHLLQCDDCD